jgi:hypothetical protein
VDITCAKRNFENDIARVDRDYQNQQDYQRCFNSEDQDEQDCQDPRIHYPEVAMFTQAITITAIEHFGVFIP